MTHYEHSYEEGPWKLSVMESSSEKMAYHIKDCRDRLVAVAKNADEAHLIVNAPRLLAACELLEQAIKFNPELAAYHDILKRYLKELKNRCQQ